MKRLQKELSKLKQKPIVGITAVPKNGDMYQWEATINGPKDSCYENGVFKLSMAFPKDYPYSPPTVKFVTKVYHCNIDSNGSICLDILKSSTWSPILKISQILLSLQSLLTDPNPDDPLVGSIATVFKQDRKKHDQTAQEWVKKYASRTG